MSTPLPPEDEQLLTRLNQHPPLRGRIERLVDLVEDVGDDLRTADEAERRVIEEVRRLGQERLEGWADGQVVNCAEALDRTPGVWREGKKALLAHYFRGYRRQRTAVPSGPAAAAPLCRACPCKPPWLLAATATGGDGPGGGPAVCAGGRQTART